MQIGFYLDTHPKKDGTYAIKLRITHNAEKRYYQTFIYCTKDEYIKITAKGARGTYKNRMQDLEIFEQKAKNIIAGLTPFTWYEFSRLFYDKAPRTGNLKEMFLQYIALLEKEGRITTAISYRCALNSIFKFRPNLSFESLTSEFLHDYEKSMLKGENSISTVGIYLRSLRTIVNIARQDGLMHTYPFGRRKYIIPAGRNIKKALTAKQLKQFIDYVPKNNTEARAKDYWLFSYYANGINFKDIALLKKSDIKGDTIIMERAKTQHTNRANRHAISIYLLPELQEIIGRRSEKGPNLFPIFKGTDPILRLKELRQFIKSTNKYTKRIGNHLKFDMPLTTYVARHTYATMLKRAGESVEAISEQLGHGSTKTTQSYLDSMDHEAKKRMAENLRPK